MVKKKWSWIAPYWVWKQTKTKRNYSATEREALAVVAVLNEFKVYIDGKEVTVASYHQPLRWLMKLKSPTGRLARWALQLQSFNHEIKYVPGTVNVFAYMLSRTFGQHKEICEVSTITIDMASRSPEEIKE